jgi:hypothetical protein
MQTTHSVIGTTYAFLVLYCLSLITLLIYFIALKSIKPIDYYGNITIVTVAISSVVIAAVGCGTDSQSIYSYKVLGAIPAWLTHEFMTVYRFRAFRSAIHVPDLPLYIACAGYLIFAVMLLG